MRKSLFTLALFLSFFAVEAKKPYSLVWNDFNIKDDTGLMVLGQVNTCTPSLDMPSRWSIGCECLDRDYADFSKIKDFYGELGSGYARIQSGWARCEKEKGVYDFEWLDKIVNGLLEEGVKPWMCLCYGNPIYTEGGISLNATIFTDKTTMDAWSRYVQAVVKHFKGRIYMYEVWNEPDSGENKKYPERYGDLFAVTAKAIRKSDVLDKQKVNALIQGIVFENPALLDPITGRVYDLSYVMLRGGQQRLENATKFTGLPLWDSPLIIIEKNAFDWTACQLPEGYVPFVDHVGI